ncbi:MAG: hypothetical protein QNJ36_12535 [Calothrix sp. MO_167.B42]|nr:hypothetical protein [Calothrix sp. MO_167.B42]
MNRKLKIILLSILLLIFFPFATAMSCVNLKFFTESCALDLDHLDPYKPPRDAILSSRWTSQNTLNIEGYVKEVRDGATLTGSYQIKGDELLLRYKVDLGEVVTTSRCTHKVVYNISGLEYKNYSISIKRLDAKKTQNP